MDFYDITALKQSCDLFRLLAVGPGGGDWAGLGGEGEGDLVAVGLAEDDLALLDGVGAVLELGDVEALLLFDVTADNFGDLDGLGHAVPDGLGSGNIDADDEGGVDQGDGVLLGLVLFLAVLVLAGVGVGAAVAGSVARCDSHALGAGLGGHLGGGGWERFSLPDVVVGADLSLDVLGGLLAHGPDLLVAVVVVDNILDGQNDRGGVGGESRNANLSIDGSVCLPAVDWRGSITISWGMVGEGQSGEDSEGNEKDLHVGDYFEICSC